MKCERRPKARAADAATITEQEIIASVPPDPDFHICRIAGCVNPGCPHACRSARRIRLHHRLVRRRRWSNELDQLCASDLERVA